MYKFLIPLFALGFLIIGCSPSKTTDLYGDSASSPASTVTSSARPDPEFDGKLLTGKHKVTLKTSKGDIELELDADLAPKAVTNFVVLAESGYYDDLTFHRVKDNFMIQGGDPNGNGTGGRSIFGAVFENEQNNIQMVRGTVAMANRGPNTNGSQFFIIQAAATPWLQGGYTAFGKVTKGMDVVDAIAKVKTDPSDRPLEPITFTPTVQK
mgnify:CR=1 FL=1